MSSDSDNLIVIGKITGAFGIKGWVKIHSFCDPADNLFHYPQLYFKLQNETQKAELVSFQAHGKGFVAQFEQIPDRNTAETFRHVEILVPRQDFAALDDDEFYWQDLIGLQVETPAGEPIGRVDNLMETGANDVLIVKDSQNKEHWIPFVLDHTIEKVDLESGKIIADWDTNYLDQE